MSNSSLHFDLDRVPNFYYLHCTPVVNLVCSKLVLENKSSLKFIILFCLVLAGCANIHPQSNLSTAKGLGESESGYTYIPIDPFPVTSIPGPECPNREDQGVFRKFLDDVSKKADQKANNYENLLDSLPDNAVRMLIEKVDASGGVTYGASKSTMKDESYRVTVDYINADTINFPAIIVKFMRRKDGKSSQSTQPELASDIRASTGKATNDQKSDDPRLIRDKEDWDAYEAEIVKLYFSPAADEDIVDPYAVPDERNYVAGSERYVVMPVQLKSKSGVNVFDNNKISPKLVALLFARQINIPVYVGVGLRVSANVYVSTAGANISGIGLIGAEAEANKLKGSLVVQTLGVNGKSVAAALPIQSELNRTTAENAILAVASIKALLHSDVKPAPRVVGFYLPLAGGKSMVNAIISALSREPLTWERPCKAPEKTTKLDNPNPVK